MAPTISFVDGGLDGGPLEDPREVNEGNRLYGPVQCQLRCVQHAARCVGTLFRRRLHGKGSWAPISD